MVYFFHHYELPAIRQQAQLQQMFMRSARTNNNNRRADNGQPGQASSGNQRMSRENQQPPTEAPTAQARPANNANNMFVMRGTRRYVNQLLHFFNLLADNNNNNANDLQNQPGRLLGQNLTRSLRMLFPNRPILNVRIINVRSASASATVADIMRHNAEGIQSQLNQNPSEEPVERIVSQVNPNDNLQESPTSPTISNGQAPLPDPITAHDANVESANAIEHTNDADVNNRVNVMRSSENGGGEGSQATSPSNEQC